jgi:hypothetical protein
MGLTIGTSPLAQSPGGKFNFEIERLPRHLLYLEDFQKTLFQKSPRCHCRSLVDQKSIGRDTQRCVIGVAGREAAEGHGLAEVGHCINNIIAPITCEVI